MIDPILDFFASIEPVVIVVAAIFSAAQLYLYRRQIRQEHEEKRREKTIEVMAEWCRSVQTETSFAEHIASKLNHEQCQSLYQMKAFDVNDDIKKDLCTFCSDNSCEKCSLKDSHRVDGDILTEFRWYVIAYLNALETVMLAWHLGIVDEDSIQEQYSFLINEGKGYALSEFRRVAGGYPITEEFIDKIKEKPSTARKKELK